MSIAYTTVPSIESYLKRLQPPNFDQIAPKLRAKPHYVLWNPKLRSDGTIEKPLYRARPALYHCKQYPASSTNPASWSTFSQAVQAYQRGGYAGIGRAFTDEEHIIFLDFDHCIDPETGEPNPIVREILDELQTNAEKSPTDGVHAYLICPILPPGLKSIYHYKGQKIEVYWMGRYSTLTGHRIAGTPADVEERQASFTALIERWEPGEEENTSGVGVCDSQSQPAPIRNQDGTAAHLPTTMSAHHHVCSPPAALVPTGKSQEKRNNNVLRIVPNRDDQAQRSAPPIVESDLPREDQAVLVKAREARNGQTFLELWEGRDPKHRKKPSGQPDESAADFDLALMLLYWTNDNAEQAERLFRASGRYREEKTDRVANRRGQSYIQHTIDNALQKRGKARRTPNKPQALNLLKQSQNLPPEQPERLNHLPFKTDYGDTSRPDPDPPTTPGPGAGQRKPARQDRRITHAHHWARAEETEGERQEKLQAAARYAAAQVEQHIRNGERSLLVANVAPGVGKSSTVAPLGNVDLNLAWIAERRNMTASVAALQHYRQIEPCTRHNCTDGHHLHNQLGERGYNAWSVHKRHKLQCHSEPGRIGYAQQFRESGSAVYQLAHVATRYPAQHEGIIIDELDITKWLPEREINIARLSAAARVYPTDSTADLFLRAVAAVITDASQARQQLHGQELFNALDRRTSNRLTNWIAELAQDPRYTNTHPWHELEEDDPIALENEAANLAPVVLPHILVALMGELVNWQRGSAWNSTIRIGPSSHGWAIHVTERRTFTPGESGLPARAILDATADSEILSRLFREQIQLVQAEIEPPPGTRHIAIRSGKRYGKTSLCKIHKDGSRPDLARAIAEARYILRKEDPDGQERQAQRIGIISFLGCVDTLGEALDIPPERRLHFWAARGSNTLEDCTILLIIGTPTIHPATVARLARALWADDPEPINPESNPDGQGIRRYIDPRMQRLNDYLTRAELTQCAHRSRALRAARTVITFCLGNIDYLPATETITDLPALTPEGREVWKVRREREHQALEQARQEIEQSGRSIHMLTVRELKAAAGVSTDAAAEYLRQARDVTQPCHDGQETHTPHTHTCVLNSVPDSPNMIDIENIGTNTTVEPRAAPPPTSELYTEYPQHACPVCGEHVWTFESALSAFHCDDCYHPEWRGGGPRTGTG